MREQRMPRKLGHYPDRQRILRVCPAKAVVNVDRPRGEVSLHFLEQTGELRGRHRLIDTAPIDARLGHPIAHDELIAG